MSSPIEQIKKKPMLSADWLKLGQTLSRLISANRDDSS